MAALGSSASGRRRSHAHRRTCAGVHAQSQQQRCTHHTDSSQKIVDRVLCASRRGFSLSLLHPKSTRRATSASAADTVGTMTDSSLTFYELVSPSGSTRAKITPFGATVTSFSVAPSVDADGKRTSAQQHEELLFVRPDAKLDGSKPISGGVPHCWPQFGPGAILQHGFARKCTFDVVDVTSSSICLRLQQNSTSETEWDANVNRSHAFHYDYRVEVMDQGKLVMTSVVKNQSTSEQMDFTAALHTYYKLPDIDQVKVYGMEGLEFLDKVQDKFNPPPVKDDQSCIRVAGPTDRIYQGVPSTLRLNTGARTITISSENWPDAVVWNPWTEMEACYRDFICVENAVAVKPIVLHPGEIWEAKVTIEA